MMREKLSTKNEITWCPGCFNFMILEATKRTLNKLIDEKYRQENFAMVTGIGCHAKIFDYLNISGFYGLHGRVIPTALGMKLGNPNLTILGFAGDGDTYAEGMAHFIHAGRYNADITLIVHDNQSFALTTGQSTPTSQRGFESKAQPLGEFNQPLNPIKLALASGVSFVARAFPKEIEHTSEIMKKAIKHKGFSFIEMIQPCLQFNKEMNEIGKLTYKIKDNQDDFSRAMLLAEEWDYNTSKGKIPIGVIYQIQKPTLSDKWPQLTEFKKKKISWKDF